MRRILVLIGLIFLSCIACCVVGVLIAPSEEELNATRTVEAQAKIDRETKQAIESATEIAVQNETATIIALTPTATPTPIPTNTRKPTNTPQPSDTPVPSSTPIPSDTPRPTNTRLVTATQRPQALTIIENVSSYGGFQVYPLPDRSSGRLFAAADTFTPHAAGRSTDGEWLFILYFDGDLQSGWVIRDSAAIPDADFNKLAVVDPDKLPSLPELTYTESAARPFGVNASISQPTQQVQSQATAEPAAVQPVATNPPAQSDTSSGGQPAPTNPPAQPNNSVSCGTCSEMASCQQAYTCLNAGHGRLDRDKDGVPCESICPGG